MEAASTSGTEGGDSQPFARFEAAIRAGDLAAANETLMRSWVDLLEGDAPRRTGALLASLDARALSRYPLLLLRAGVGHYASVDRRARSWQYLARASAAAHSGLVGARPGERVMLLTGESIGFRLARRLTFADAAARSALKLLSSAPLEELERIGHLPSLLAQLGRSCFEAGNVRDATSAFTRGLSEAAPGSREGFSNIAMLAGIPALEGEVLEAERRIRTVHEPVWARALEEHGSGYLGVHLRLAEAVVALERFDTDAAERALAQVGCDPDTIEWWATIAAVEATALLVRGQPAEALAHLEGWMRRRGGDPDARKGPRELVTLRATLQLSLGYVDLAAKTLHRHGSARSVDVQVASARVDLARGRLHAALNALRSLEIDAHSPRLQAEALAIEAAALLRLPPLPRREAAIDRLAAMLARTGMAIPVALLPKSDFERVADALARRRWSRPLAARALLDDIVPLTLTRRERVLLDALAQPDATRASIAAEMHVSVNTVKTQLQSLYRKLGVSTREAALAVASERNLFQPLDERLSDLDDPSLEPR